MSSILRDILTNDQLIMVIVRLQSSDDPIAPALLAALLGKAPTKPAAAAAAAATAGPTVPTVPTAATATKPTVAARRKTCADCGKVMSYDGWQYHRKSPTACAKVRAAPATAPAPAAPAPAAPAAAAARYTLNRSEAVPTEFLLHAAHLGKAAIKEKLCISADRKLADMKAIMVPTGSDGGFARIAADEAEHIKPILFPVFKSKAAKTKLNPADYNVLFIFRATSAFNICYKGAFAHKVTGDIVMLTAARVEPTHYKHTSSRIGGWFVCSSEMAAPPCFWNAFKVL
jgi:hypothetical protein